MKLIVLPKSPSNAINVGKNNRSEQFGDERTGREMTKSYY